MNRTDFYKLFSEMTGMPQCKSKDICCAMFDLLSRCIHEDEWVYIKGLGTFKHKTLKARRVGDLKGGEAIEIPEKTKIVFEPFKSKYVDDEDSEEFVEE